MPTYSASSYEYDAVSAANQQSINPDEQNHEIDQCTPTHNQRKTELTDRERRRARFGTERTIQHAPRLLF